MVVYTQIISNEKVVVVNHSMPKQVVVTDKTNGNTKIFAGYPLDELFDEFKDSFNDNISCETACNHFIPKTFKA